jgi:transposase-like protein
MTGRVSSATERALRLIAKGHTVAQAARKFGLAWSTLYRAQLRAGTRQKRPSPRPETLDQ